MMQVYRRIRQRTWSIRPPFRGRTAVRHYTDITLFRQSQWDWLSWRMRSAIQNPYDRYDWLSYNWLSHDTSAKQSFCI